MDEKISIVVAGEHTFGYVEDMSRKPVLSLHVLAVDVLRGGNPQVLSKTVVVRPEQCRPATLADFKAFKVRPEGYLENPMYDFIRE